ncbi:hypothetical protein H0H93_005436, partial [Arthromyces matolae]
AGADREIVNSLGKTPAECAFGLKAFDSDSDATEDDIESDEEAQWGDAEEESETSVRQTPVKRPSRRLLRRGTSSGKVPSVISRSLDISRPVTPVPEASEKKGEDTSGDNEKQAAS